MFESCRYLQTLLSDACSAGPQESSSTKAVPSEIFCWRGLRRGDEVDVADNGLVIARGVIEVVKLAEGMLRLELSYGKGKRTFSHKDGWQVRAVCRDHQAARDVGTNLRFHAFRPRSARKVPALGEHTARPAGCPRPTSRTPRQHRRNVCAEC